MRSTGPYVLVFDNDPGIRFYLHKNLKANGYVVADAASGRTVLRAVMEAVPDLIVLGLEPPDMDGMGLVRSVRRASPLPIVALSARGDEDVAVEALESGADDFIRKPFGIREFVARVRNALRRTAQARGELPLFVAGDLEIDFLRRHVHARGREVHLSKIEYDVLRLLAQRGGQVLTHRELLEAVWGPMRANRVQYLRVAISTLRRKIEGDPARPRHILTEPRIGYRLQEW